MEELCGKVVKVRRKSKSDGDGAGFRGGSYESLFMHMSSSSVYMSFVRLGYHDG